MFVAVAAASLFVASAAPAQTAAPDAGTTTAPNKKTTTKKKTTTTKKKTTKKSRKKPAAPPKPEIDEETRKALESMSPATGPADAGVPVQQPPPATAVQEPAGPVDSEPPTLTHTPVTTAKKGKPLTITAHATDASGVFGPVLYLRKKGMPAADYIPMRMTPSRTGTPGDYSLEIPPALVSVDALEYYIEAWDNVGNGPARYGQPDAPIGIKVEEEKKVVVAPPTPPTKVEIKPKGAPPAITHNAVTSATKGQPIEINARLGGDTGVQGATVMFRHVGEKDYKALPMGNIGGNDYTATVPAGMATSDIEYYLEAFDKYGNGPGRSGAPNVPYTIKVREAQPIPPTRAAGPQIVKAPFSPNPGRAAGWLLMGTFVGGLVFAGGEAFASWQANNSYTHTFTYEGRLDQGMLDKANLYGRRAKTAAIVSGISLVGAIVLLVVFPERSDTVVVGGGGDVGVRF
ncbi:MAG: hypothetical protein ABR567_17110 [Myxococcales bacterium]|nr:hypothetical protein [Myxococcales bacterium]